MWNETDPTTKETVRKIGTLHQAILENAWVVGEGRSMLDIRGYMPELDIPNLSLNKGIKRRSQGWFYCAAALGIGLQIGKFMIFYFFFLFLVGGGGLPGEPSNKDIL